MFFWIDLLGHPPRTQSDGPPQKWLIVKKQKLLWVFCSTLSLFSDRYLA